MTGLHHTNPEHFFSVPNASSTRGHSKKLSKPQVRTTQRLNSFSRRVISDWNQLPEEVVSAPSLNAFKNRLDKHWVRHPLKHAHE